jgi:hypothetical protein
MKQAAKFLVVSAVAVSISVLVSTTWAGPGHFGGGRSDGGFGGRSWGGRGWGGRGWGGWGWGWGGWYPWGFSYAYAPSPYYSYDGYYYPPTAYYPPPVVYSSQPAEAYNSPPPAPVADSQQQPVVDRPLSPTAVDRDSPPPPPRAQWTPQIQRSDQGQSISVADVKALVKAGLNDEIILSHIRNSQAVYHLTTAEIIDLKNSGVSDKVIDFMINTASAHR